MSGLAALLWLVPAAPVALALASCTPAVGSRLIRLLPWAPAPALLAALLVPSGVAAPLPDLMLGAGLMLDQPARVFLAVASILWSLAGLYAGSYLDRARAVGFCRWWLATLAGNLLLIVAGDVVSFYLGFSLMSLAAVGLVVHERTAEAIRAARVYLILAVFGETCLLLGFMAAAASAGDIGISGVREALRDGEHRHLALGLMIVSFGLKAGLAPLHVWLPLAHPAAPIPASAVLSGVMVKAGVFGLLRFLPIGDSAPVWGDLLVGFGLATAYGAVVVGLFQSRPKTILAYSTCSQMGLLVCVIGAGASGADPGRLYESVTLYAAHHSLAKGALFLGLGVLTASAGLWRPATMTLALMAVSVAGLPLTGGALAKLVVKGPVGEGLWSVLLTLSAIGTTLLMLRFLQTALQGAKARTDPVPVGMSAAFYLTAVGAAAVPWWLYIGPGSGALAYPLAVTTRWAGLWPILAGAALVVACRRVPWRPGQIVPEGDLVVLAEAAAGAGRRALFAQGAVLAARRRRHAIALGDPLAWAERLEQAFLRWRVSATLLAGGVLIAWLVLATH